MFGSLNSMETEIKTINAPMKKDFCLKEKIAKFCDHKLVRQKHLQEALLLEIAHLFLPIWDKRLMHFIINEIFDYKNNWL